ncbi:MAG: transposase, partial [Candidatus Micrarchaeales archaeon]
LHIIVDAETEIPIVVEVIPANTNDKKLFDPLYNKVKKIAVLQYQSKFLADSQYDSADIKSRLRNDSMIPVIATNGRGHYKSEMPKDPDYGKRWSVEHVFSRLKEVFGLEANRFFGLKKVTIHIFSCLLAHLLRYKM